MNKETVNGDASLSNSGPGSVPPRNPSQGPVPQQPNFPASQAQVGKNLLFIRTCKAGLVLSVTRGILRAALPNSVCMYVCVTTPPKPLNRFA